MHLCRGGRGRIEELEVLPRRDCPVVVAGEERGLSLDEQREDVGWIGAVPDRVAADPERVDRAQIGENGLQRDEVRVDVAEDADPHAAASRAARIVKRFSASARPITTDATPRDASARTSSRSRTPPPACNATLLPTTARTVSTRASGGPASCASAARSIRYRARTPANCAARAEARAPRPVATVTRSGSPPRGAR